jgi:DUF971 family protein
VTAAAFPADLAFNKTAAELRIRFDDGFEGAIPYELLRVESPSAETQGHGAGSRPPPPSGKQTVGVTGAEPVGRYAVRIRFSDGHDTGLFTWAYLRELAEDKDARMTAYLARLSESGGKRS